LTGSNAFSRFVDWNTPITLRYNTTNNNKQQEQQQQQLQLQLQLQEKGWYQ
jgi:hypothetical protein